MPYRTRKTNLSRFNQLMRAHLDRTTESKKLTQGEIAERIGVSRATLLNSTYLPRAFGFGSLEKFIEIAHLTGDARADLEQAWFEDWVTTRKLGSAVRVFIEAAIAGTSPKQRRELFAEAIRLLRKDEEADR